MTLDGVELSEQEELAWKAFEAGRESFREELQRMREEFEKDLHRIMEME